MKRRHYVFLVLELICIFSLLNGSYISLIWIVNLAYVQYVINRIEKKKDGKLTPQEKYSIIATELLSPLVAGTFYYLCLKKKFPQKASIANTYSFLLVTAEFFIYFVASLIFFH